MRSTTTAADGRAATTADLVGRLRVLTVARLLAVVITGAAVAPSLDAVREPGSPIDLLAAASAVYLVLNFLALVLLRSSPDAAGKLMVVTLLLDAAWVTLVVASTGGPFSPFVFLLYLQLVAVTVLVGWRASILLVLADTAGLVAVAWVEAATGPGLQVIVPGFELPLWSGLGAEGDRAAVITGTVFVVATSWITTAATAYFSQVNERDLRRSNRELAVLRDLTTELEKSLEIDDVCEAIARGVVSELGYRRAVIWMAEGNALTPAGAEGFAPEELAVIEGLALTVGPGPVGRSVESRTPQLVAREHARPAALADAFAIDSPLVIVPLISEGRLLGLLTVEVAAPIGRAPRLKGRDLRILTTLATEASLALDNARLHRELRDLSVTDALTGVYNHRYFQQRLQEELDRTVRATADGQPQQLSLAIVDIDFFKKVNDRFGHPSGDELLRSFAKLMDRVLRSSDVVCRYGGEEFTVILPETNREEALQVAERLREAVQRSNFMGADGRYLGQVTASVGVDTYTEGLPSRSEMITRADEALYEAKETGRNRVVHADRPTVAA